MTKIRSRWLTLICCLLLVSSSLFGAGLISAQTPTTEPANVYVDPLSGDDNGSGTSPDLALASLTEAWNRIPADIELQSGFTINLLPGKYAEPSIPNYLENRLGQPGAPISIVGVGDRANVVLLGDLNIFNVHHLTVSNLTIASGGDALHCEQCSYLTLDNIELNGSPNAWETLKINQSSQITITNSDIHGAGDNAIDMVAVQNAVVRNNTIHDAGDWCAYAKGGSVDILIESNEIFDCGTGGFTAGQGTGLQYMVPPHLTWEAERITVRDNHIHDTDGAAVGVAGGHEILIDGNLMERVGARSHLIEVVYGSRSCDGPADDASRDRCAEFLALGGWGTTEPGGSEGARIPNSDVVIINNQILNPTGYSSQWQHFWIAPPMDEDQFSSTGVPLPLQADAGLVISGNTIVNGSTAMPLGIGDEQSGCRDNNPTCNAAQLYQDNDINGQ